MLIIVKNFTRANFERFNDALENLYRAHADGSHLVVTIANKTEAQSCNYEFGRKGKYGLANSLSWRQEARSLMDKLPVYIEVDCCQEDEAVDLVERCYRCGIRFFEEQSVSEPCTVLLENLRDSYVVKEIIRAGLKKSGLQSSFRLNYKLMSGNGGDIRIHWLGLKQERKNFLCIVDSDVKYPGGPIGTTASSVDSGYADEGIGETLILDVNEVENLIPFKLLPGLMGQAFQEKVEVYDSLEVLAGADPEVLKYFDFKDGVWVKRYRTPEYRRYWNGDKGFDLPARCERCLDLGLGSDGACNKDQSCKLIYGFGNNLCETVQEELSRVSPHKLFESMHEHEKNEWERLSNKLIGWTFSSRPVRAV